MDYAKHGDKRPRHKDIYDSPPPPPKSATPSSQQAYAPMFSKNYSLRNGASQPMPGAPEPAHQPQYSQLPIHSQGSSGGGSPRHNPVRSSLFTDSQGRVQLPPIRSPSGNNGYQAAGTSRSHQGSPVMPANNQAGYGTSPYSQPLHMRSISPSHYDSSASQRHQLPISRMHHQPTYHPLATGTTPGSLPSSESSPPNDGPLHRRGSPRSQPMAMNGMPAHGLPRDNFHQHIRSLSPAATPQVTALRGSHMQHHRASSADTLVFSQQRLGRAPSTSISLGSKRDSLSSSHDTPRISARRTSMSNGASATQHPRSSTRIESSDHSRKRKLSAEPTTLPGSVFFGDHIQTQASPRDEMMMNGIVSSSAQVELTGKVRRVDLLEFLRDQAQSRERREQMRMQERQRIEQAQIEEDRRFHEFQMSLMNIIEHRLAPHATADHDDMPVTNRQFSSVNVDAQ
ncbi:hypothetical protein DL89DRAFT_253972 [Linderina pennispora]|uniref:Uncharacterized protein n=1 Tax=Linderina pennispora TaxID=61395 RepID=A0A1Y1WKR4_9FUNG|nr:uncharacterized protein DL89DRAFT_253972 [Linderina pennispora]ORX74082.1 hypothetical protein DL89DRAFT_253972 [Linderina pennispora]